MRRRLLTLVFSTTLLALTILGVVLVAVIWAAMGSAMQNRAGDTARVAASGLEELVEAHGTITEDTLRGYVRDEAWLRATLPDGSTFSTGAAPTGSVFDGRDTQVTPAGESVTVEAKIPLEVNVKLVRSQGFVVIALSVFALAVSMVIALFYARRLTRPLEDFAEAAGRLATGDRRQVSRRYGIAELDAVADVLDQGASNFNDLLESERRVTAETSHQLRTPLTALSLRLEEILASDDLDVVHAEATAALGQVERLSGVVDDVVSVSRGFPLGPQSRYSLDALVESQVLEWTPTFQAAGREIRSQGLSRLEIDGAFGAQSQALGTLIENALQHGAGRTTVRVRSSGTWAVVEVSDEGSGVAPDVEPRVFERNVSGGNSSGLGLALARTLVSADGGRLELLSSRPAVFAMFLPAIQVVDEVAAEPPLPDLASAEMSSEQARPEPLVPAAAPPAVEQSDVERSVVAQATVEMASSSAASVSSGKTQRR